MKIINLTPHQLTILTEDPQGELEGTVDIGPSARFTRYRKVAEIPPSGHVARAVQREEIVGSVQFNGTKIPIVRISYGEPVGLPEPETDTYYYVSVITAQAAAAHGRSTDDLIFSGKSVRDKNGRIIGILSFARI